MIDSYRVLITKSADIDMQMIYDYIADILASVDNANSTLSIIKEKILSLEKVPKRGKLYPNEPWKSKELRMVFANNFTIFYYVFDNEKVVKVIMVAYSAMEFDKLLEKFEKK